jgi:hypothetical protein
MSSWVPHWTLLSFYKVCELNHLNIAFIKQSPLPKKVYCTKGLDCQHLLQVQNTNYFFLYWNNYRIPRCFNHSSLDRSYCWMATWLLSQAELDWRLDHRDWRPAAVTCLQGTSCWISSIPSHMAAVRGSAGGDCADSTFVAKMNKLHNFCCTANILLCLLQPAIKTVLYSSCRLDIVFIVGHNYQNSRTSYTLPSIYAYIYKYRIYVHSDVITYAPYCSLWSPIAKYVTVNNYHSYHDCKSNGFWVRISVRNGHGKRYVERSVKDSVEFYVKLC